MSKTELVEYVYRKLDCSIDNAIRIPIDLSLSFDYAPMVITSGGLNKWALRRRTNGTYIYAYALTLPLINRFTSTCDPRLDMMRLLYLSKVIHLVAVEYGMLDYDVSDLADSKDEFSQSLFQVGKNLKHKYRHNF